MGATIELPHTHIIPETEKLTNSTDTPEVVKVETKENLSTYKKELLTPNLPNGAFELAKNVLKIKEPINIKIVKKSIQDYQKKQGLSIDKKNPMI
jgi:hypothetical protein